MESINLPFNRTTIIMLKNIIEEYFSITYVNFLIEFRSPFSKYFEKRVRYTVIKLLDITNKVWIT